MKKLTLTIFVILLALPALAEEDFAGLLKRAEELKAQGKYPAAMEELSWANKQLEKLHQESLKKFFPDTAGSFTGGKFDANNAMGFMNVERDYKSQAGAGVKVSLLGASNSQGSAAQGFGALAGFAQMAAMMDGQNGAETVRVKGNRAVVAKNGRYSELSLNLPSGLMFKVEQTSGQELKAEELASVAEAIDTTALEAYLKTR
ncbi:hypothetical protein JNK13_01275 [bacterium]|nr:hypothetical protein [bacterium]